MKKTRNKLLVLLLCMILAFNSLPVFTSASFTESISWQQKLDTYLLANLDSLTGKVPVWLWMEDIDFNVVHEKVYMDTGLTEKDLTVVDSEISDELAYNLANYNTASASEKSKITTDFKTYLKATESARKVEKERVDKYLTSLRSHQKEMHNTKNASILKKLGIKDEDIIAFETRAPMCIVNIDASRIKEITSSSLVTSIDYYDKDAKWEIEGTEEYNLSSLSIGSTLGFVKSEIGLTGDGVSVGMIDDGKINPNEIPSTRTEHISNDTDAVSVHATNVGKIIGAANGVANECFIYTSKTYEGVEWGEAISNIVSTLSGNNVAVINLSGGLTSRRTITNNTSYYDPTEKYIDYTISNERISFVKSAGNDSNAVSSPGLAYNVITVGGFFNNGTIANADDTAYISNNYNEGTGCEKPDFLVDQTGNGTSFAAPFATGVIALLYELRPSLMTEPEAVKAIMMASCHRKVTPATSNPIETMVQGITDYQGCGAIDPYIAVSIVAKNNYGYRILGENDTMDNVNFTQPKYGATGLNFSITWFRNNSSSNVASPMPNLQLTLSSGNSYLGSSVLGNSSTEMVYITPLEDTKNYTASIIRPTTSDGAAVKYAYAFSTNDTRYHYADLSNGIFYIKNKATEKYLTLSNGELTQEDLDYSDSQVWLVKNGRIHASTQTKNRLTTDEELDETYVGATTSTGGAGLTIEQNNSGNLRLGCVSFTVLSEQVNLSVLNHSNSAGTSIAWESMWNSSDYQKWYLEPAAYEKGDINRDGIINATDSSLAMQYAVNTVTPSDIQKYLADIDGDGSVTSSDALYIQQNPTVISN